MITLLAQWFAPSPVAQDYSRTDYVLLWLILAAGTLARFWGLDNVGLHGDEETMAMPAMAILESGEPYLPSGMYYSRALLNIYLMSGSVWLFGESEWALRLPSAIVGSLAGLVAFFMGRRFLPPQVNVAFVATMTFLPGMIEISQTARMYVFFVASVMWFAACVFRWERDERLSSLILAILVWMLALHFHRLAIFTAPLFLYPGFSRQSWRCLGQGIAAFAVGGVAYEGYARWIRGKYPAFSERPPPMEEEVWIAPIEVLTGGGQWPLVVTLAAIAAGLFFAWRSAATRTDWTNLLPVAVTAFGLAAMATLNYHIGGILLLFGFIFWFRAAGLKNVWLVMPAALAVLMALAHLWMLHQTGEYPGRQIIGALVGTPSVWPLLRFLEYSPAAGAIFAALFAYALWRFANGERLPMHVFFFVMAVWAPLLLLGFFAWYLPPRYALGQLGFFLMSLFALLVWFAHDRHWLALDKRLTKPLAAAAVTVAVLLINPVSFSTAVNPSYERYPDHKGAADFIESLVLDSDAILIAEDALQQTYYLGEVDYSLRPYSDAHRFSFVRDGRLYDQYTGAPVLTSGEELSDLLSINSSKDVYIIGSGENFVGGKRNLRGEGIAEVLQSDRLIVVYSGRDSKTKVWKLR